MESAAVYLTEVVKPLLGFPDELRVEQVVDERGVLLTLSLKQEDMGRIIGKSGDTARAIRRLIRQFGMTQKAHISVKINEPAGSTHRQSHDDLEDI